METGMRKTLIATTLLLAAGFANAADAPARKSGLWEMTNNMSGPQPMTTTMQQCVDEKTDKLADQPGDMKQNCSKNDISRSGGKVIVDSVCKFEGTTATTHAEFSGDFGSNYRGLTGRLDLLLECYSYIPFAERVRSGAYQAYYQQNYGGR